ncbi:hypothetical protein KOI35_11650 [Actinoplanes bogorensis]|uniref:DUF998 domain-containing protein n=1 Tax=Paractinoplanes bogorensis TaxID=1610840 RepID=A0ABS5YL31_9ACTN|nr:hypothetical protein [Actinoplanes bogorensis]MBU2664147.1 hypothetical protein [Actinoplanes bogorensis]
MTSVLALLALAPWTAECVWGGFPVTAWPFVIIILAGQYGGAAVLIREVARRTGGGWPAIVLMAAAFGFVQAGLVDQSLFNPSFLDRTSFAADAAAARDTWIPGLSFSGQQAFAYVGGHIALSICAPIAIVESCTTSSGPWLGRRGLAAVAVFYVLGSLLIFRDVYGDEHFFASPVQVGFTLLVVLALIGLALTRRARVTVPSDARVPHPGLVALVVAVPHVVNGLVPGWGGVALSAGVVAVVVALIVRWSRRAGWGQRHVLAAWGSGLVVAAASAYVVPTYEATSAELGLISDIAISVVTVALLTLAWRRQRAARAPVAS